MRKEWNILVMPVEQHYESIWDLRRDVVGFQKSRLFDWQKKGVDLPLPGQFEQVQRKDGKIMLVPAAMDYTVLFRGQGGFFYPCKPTLYRGDKTELDIFICRLKQVEFELLISTMPVVRYFRHKNYLVDAKGLAQHYGLDTDVLDLTSSFDVATFFAMCDHDSTNDVYVPKKEDKQYIGYIYAYPALFEAMSGTNEQSTLYADQVSCIGLQPFERPGRQSGFSMELKQGRSFQGYVYSFTYTKEDSEFIYNHFNHDGRRLWESDIISGRARLIRDTKRHTLYALRRCVKQYGDGRPAYEYRKELESQGYIFVKHGEWDFNAEELSSMDRRMRDGGWYDIESLLVHKQIISADGEERPYRSTDDLWRNTMMACAQYMPVAPQGYDSGITYTEEEMSGHKVWGWGYHYGRVQTFPNPITGRIDRWDNLLDDYEPEILSAPMKPRLVRRDRTGNLVDVEQ